MTIYKCDACGKEGKRGEILDCKLTVSERTYHLDLCLQCSGLKQGLYNSKDDLVYVACTLISAFN